MVVHRCLTWSLEDKECINAEIADCEMHKQYEAAVAVVGRKGGRSNVCLL